MRRNSNFIVVIPARFGSKRLPGKPLKKILGVPMVIRTSMQCLKVVKRSQLIVATDDIRIQKCCKKYSINSMLTSKKCKTGTDRVAEVAKKIKVKNYINVQGDEPIFNPIDLKNMIKHAKKNRNKILLGYTKIENKINIGNKNIPKVVFDKNENLLYASRNPIPFVNLNKSYKSWRQVLVYSFPRVEVLKFYNMRKKTFLEEKEDIEILRFLEIGSQVKLVKMTNKSHPVDTMKDLHQVERFLNNEKINLI
jgi:3-deoxy-manno-octulosonate cytidylyltransferase (CMP-KDO synthetase)